MPTGSFETIKIHRAIPIIAGIAQLPPNFEKHRDTVRIVEMRNRANEEGISFPKITLFGAGSRQSLAGGKHGGQEFIELDGVALDGIDVAYNIFIVRTSSMSGQEY